MEYKYKIIDDYAIIYLENTNNEIHETYIDLHNLEKVINYNYKWGATYRKNIDNYYVSATAYLGMINGTPKYKSILLHAFIMGSPDCKVDHIIPSKTLDNRESNLRLVKNKENGTNRKSKNKNNVSGYRNVFWSTKDARWLVMLQVEGKQTCFGRFKLDEIDLAGIRAEESRQEVYGEFAGSN